ncbi:MAG: hypothetical protein KAU62_08420 [Candidatus Heimdallarchaeota archaeon]|nr:hypothetical protein [Candidatus Heimdallarchaeota archaeon]MCK4611163.1 hypothetical protein [Candidatus Heimdallarchaeota archaeon]
MQLFLKQFHLIYKIYVKIKLLDLQMMECMH